MQEPNPRLLHWQADSLPRAPLNLRATPSPPRPLQSGDPQTQGLLAEGSLCTSRPCPRPRLKSEHPRGKARVWGTAAVAALPSGSLGTRAARCPTRGWRRGWEGGVLPSQRQSRLSPGRPAPPHSHAETPGQPGRPAPSFRPDLLPAGMPTVGMTSAGIWEHAHLSGAQQGLPGTTASRPGSTPEPSPAPPGRQPRWRRRGHGEWGNS